MPGEKPKKRTTVTQDPKQKSDMPAARAVYRQSGDQKSEGPTQLCWPLVGSEIRDGKTAPQQLNSAASAFVSAVQASRTTVDLMEAVGTALRAFSTVSLGVHRSLQAKPG